MKKIYKFQADFGRMGDLEGVFVSTDEQLHGLYGEEIYFGEVLGKHSEVILTLDPKHITEVTDDEKFIELFEQYNLENGYNPFDYYEDEADEYDDAEDWDEEEDNNE
jgi:hypothetical protein